MNWKLSDRAEYRVVSNQEIVAKVPCRYCGRDAGRNCLAADSSEREWLHQKRLDDFRRWAEWHAKGSAA